MAKGNTFNVNGAAAPIGDPFDVTGNGAGGTVHVQPPAVPEPSAWELWLAGAALIAARRRFARKRG